jgi:hypothetical protein
VSAIANGIRCTVLRREQLSFNTIRLSLACGHSIIRRTICKARQATVRCPSCSRAARRSITGKEAEARGLRKGATVAGRDTKPLTLKPNDPRAIPEEIRFLIATSTEDCRSGAAHATRAQLIEAHRWCERHPEGQKTRKEILAQALRKRQATAETERVMAAQREQTLAVMRAKKGGRS